MTLQFLPVVQALSDFVFVEVVLILVPRRLLVEHAACKQMVLVPLELQPAVPLFGLWGS